MIKSLEDLQKIKNDYNKMLSKYKHIAFVCGGTGCVAANCGAVEETLKNELQKRGMAKDVAVIKRGCMGTCAVGPVVYVLPEGAYYTEMTPEKDAQSGGKPFQKRQGGGGVYLLRQHSEKTYPKYRGYFLL